MTSIYNDGTYLSNNPDWHEEDSAWKAGEILKIVLKNHLSPKSICEIGCGAGEILKQLYHKLPDNVQFQGFEISGQAFKIAEKKTCDRISFLNTNILECNNNCFYDLLLIIDVIEHVDNYVDFIKSIKGLAKYKIFHIPLDLSAQSVLRKNQLVKLRTTAGHIHYFTKATALAALKDAGYEILDYTYTGSHIYAKTYSLKARLMKLPRLCLFNIDNDLAANLLGGFSLMVLAK